MFTIPVLITKSIKQNFYIDSMADWTIITVTIIAIYYFMTGLAALIGHKAYRFFHYLGVALTLALTAGLTAKILSVQLSVDKLYFLPVTLSFILAITVWLTREKKQPATN